MASSCTTQRSSVSFSVHSGRNKLLVLSTSIRLLLSWGLGGTGICTCSLKCHYCAIAILCAMASIYSSSDNSWMTRFCIMSIWVFCMSIRGTYQTREGRRVHSVEIRNHLKSILRCFSLTWFVRNCNRPKQSSGAFWPPNYKQTVILLNVRNHQYLPI